MRVRHRAPRKGGARCLWAPLALLLALPASLASATPTPGAVVVALPRAQPELEERFFALDWSPSEGLRAVVAEWLATNRFPELEFRDSAVGRRAAVRGGPEVWEVVAIAENAGGGPGGLDAARTHFAWVEQRGLEQALSYADTYPGEIRRIIERNRRLAGGGGP